MILVNRHKKKEACISIIIFIMVVYKYKQEKQSFKLVERIMNLNDVKIESVTFNSKSQVYSCRNFLFLCTTHFSCHLFLNNMFNTIRFYSLSLHDKQCYCAIAAVIKNDLEFSTHT